MRGTFVRFVRQNRKGGVGALAATPFSGGPHRSADPVGRPIALRIDGCGISIVQADTQRSVPGYVVSGPVVRVGERLRVASGQVLQELLQRGSSAVVVAALELATRVEVRTRRAPLTEPE